MARWCQGRVSAAAGVAVVVAMVMVCGVGMQVQPASAAVQVQHKVGGSGVWTISPKLSYSRWAASKIFRTNDILVFNYPVGLHNVVMVSRLEYLQCKVRKPMATYKNGRTRVKLGKKGTYFFICSVPGHCQAGMKMAIIVR